MEAWEKSVNKFYPPRQFEQHFAQSPRSFAIASFRRIQRFTNLAVRMNFSRTQIWGTCHVCAAWCVPGCVSGVDSFLTHDSVLSRLNSLKFFSSGGNIFRAYLPQDIHSIIMFYFKLCHTGVSSIFSFTKMGPRSFVCPANNLGFRGPLKVILDLSAWAAPLPALLPW